MCPPELKSETRTELVAESFIGVGRPLPPDHPLASWISEACQEPFFCDRWNDERDHSFPAFAAACLTLGRIEIRDHTARLALYSDIATKRRRMVLGTIARTPVLPATIRLLARTEWWHFTADDWAGLLAAVNDGFSHQLAELDVVSPMLVHQIADVPAAFRRTNIFKVLNTLRVPSRRWRKLATALPLALAREPSAVAAAIRSIRSIGDFWDTYFLCTTDYLKPFPWIKTIEPYLTDLQPLANIEEMEAEALRMDNCLKKLVGQAATGYRLYFRLRNGPPLTAELKRTAGGWQPGEILGPRNQAVGADLADRITRELALLANHLPMADPSPKSERIAEFIDGLRRFASMTFPPKDIDRLASALLTIRGRAHAWTDGAYTIFSINTGGFVQFMSSADGTEYLCEIASHKYGQEREKYLTPAAVDVIEGSGFLWPTGEQNFIRWFPIAGPDDCRAFAELSLALLTKVFGYTSEQRLKVETVVPKPQLQAGNEPD